VRQAANAVASARLRLNLATPLGGTDPDNAIRGGLGGRSREAFGMIGV
jgi:hypothetical protein